MDHRTNVKKPLLYVLIILMIAIYFLMTGHLRKAFKPFDITKDDVIGFKNGNQTNDTEE